MKKVNFKKLTNQFLAGLFGLALMGGVMLNSQEAEAQEFSPGGDDCTKGNPTWRTEWSDMYNTTVCYPGGACCCAYGN